MPYYDWYGALIHAPLTVGTGANTCCAWTVTESDRPASPAHEHPWPEPWCADCRDYWLDVDDSELD